MHAAHLIAAMSLGALVLACGDGGPSAPGGGAALAIANRTSGDPLQSDGYLVRVDGKEHALAVGGSIALSGLDPGDHRVELTRIAAGCTVSGANPRVVHARAAEQAQTLFLVACTAPGTGRVFVQTSTYGEPEGDYLIEITGEAGLPIGTKDTLTLRAIPAGPVTLGLTRLGHCAVAGRNPRTLVVPLGFTIGSIFKVRCDLPPSTAPQLRARRAGPRLHPPSPE